MFQNEGEIEDWRVADVVLREHGIRESVGTDPLQTLHLRAFEVIHDYVHFVSNADFTLAAILNY